METSDFDSGFFQSKGDRVDLSFDGADAEHERIDLVQPAQLPFVNHRNLASQILKFRTQLFQIIHFLRRSYASLGEQRAVSEARPALILTPFPETRNADMEAAVPDTLLIPLTFEQKQAAQLRLARYVVSHPAQFADQLDYVFTMRGAWETLKADQKARREAQRAADAVRPTFPEDAA